MIIVDVISDNIAEVRVKGDDDEFWEDIDELKKSFPKADRSWDEANKIWIIKNLSSNYKNHPDVKRAYEEFKFQLKLF